MGEEAVWCTLRRRMRSAQSERTRDILCSAAPHLPLDARASDIYGDMQRLAARLHAVTLAHALLHLLALLWTGMPHATTHEGRAVRVLSLLFVFVTAAYALPALAAALAARGDCVDADADRERAQYACVLLRWAFAIGAAALAVDALYLGLFFVPAALGGGGGDDGGLQCAPGGQRWRCTGTFLLILVSVLATLAALALMLYLYRGLRRQRWRESECAPAGAAAAAPHYPPLLAHGRR